MSTRAQAGAPVRARALVVATTVAGGAIVAVAPFRLDGATLALAALFAAAAVVSELVAVHPADDGLDSAGHNFSFSSGVHLAATVVLGPFAAALVAAVGVVVADGLVTPLRKVAFNASMFAVAALAGGGVFLLLGGTPGRLDLPQDIPAALGLALTAYTVNLVLISGILSFTVGTAFWPMVAEKARGLVAAGLGEAALGLALAVFVLREPWAVVLLIPLVLTLYLAEARLAALRTETARALETFANVVDERDPYTFRHSVRVAEYVRTLAEQLQLPASTVSRLAWAGRLHDLGKIAVDAAALRKPAKLDVDEWAAMQRHPRLSARLLRGFRFAAEEARAVEYHHERADGRGYYRLPADEIPLASHFLIVADTFDAMTTDRPYRPARSRDEALAEIERGIGTQFHPAVARAFVALQRGQDPAAVLAPAELRQLRAAFRPRWSFAGWRRGIAPALAVARVLAVVGALTALGLGEPAVALAASLLAAAGIVHRLLEERRALRLADRLHAVASLCERPSEALVGLGGALAGVCDVRWAALVDWHESAREAPVTACWGDGAWSPDEAELSAWLARRGDDGDELVVAREGELGDGVTHVALTLRREATVRGYLVLGLAQPPTEPVERGLRRCADAVARLLDVDAPIVELPHLAAAS